MADTLISGNGSDTLLADASGMDCHDCCEPDTVGGCGSGDPCVAFPLNYDLPLSGFVDANEDVFGDGILVNPVLFERLNGLTFPLVYMTGAEATTAGQMGGLTADGWHYIGDPVTVTAASTGVDEGFAGGANIQIRVFVAALVSCTPPNFDVVMTIQVQVYDMADAPLLNAGAGYAGIYDSGDCLGPLVLDDTSNAYQQITPVVNHATQPATVTMTNP